MNVEEIIKNLREQVRVIRKYDVEESSEKNAAALELAIEFVCAGRIMRKGIRIHEQEMLFPEKMYLENGAQAWDAVLGDDE